jgi:hypothetical protein
MRQARSFWLFVGAIMALLFVTACGLLQPAEPWPTRPAASTTAVSQVTFAPTDTPIPSASVTPMPGPTDTPQPAGTVVSPTLTPTPTDTPVPSTPTATQVPPTPTSTPTRIPPTPTFTSTPVSPTPTRTSLPPVTITDWRGEYYANRRLESPPTTVRNDRVVDLRLSSGAAPAPGMPSENWSARWSRTWDFEEGNYRFHLLVDDGARLWVGGRLLIDAWADGPSREFTGDLYLKGKVPIQLDYYNRTGEARARLNWERITQFSGWKGSYYTGRNLSGLPVFQRDDPVISFNWGSGSPRPDLQADDFSVRWSRRINFGQAGLYRFRAEADDGVRLWIDGTLAVDAWRDGYSLDEVVVNLTAGNHDLRVEYYEHLGGALVQVSWDYAPATLTPTATPTGTPSATPTATATATSTSTPTATGTFTATPTGTSTATPTATHTDTPTTTPTVTHTATPTGVPSDTPTATDTPVPPTDTPVPIKPVIVLQPDTGPVNTPFAVIGSGWPANTAIELFLVRPIPDAGAPILVAEVTTDGTGAFTLQLVIPSGEGWEAMPAAVVLAQSTDRQHRAQATYQLLPELTHIPFASIPADGERFALQQPTYLVLDTETAWVEWFGSEPPPANPPLDWQRELVLAAFLGPQPIGVQVDVNYVVQRATSVSVWLTALIPEGGTSAEGETHVPRVMVRVSRDSLLPSGQQAPAGLIFAFLDARGRLLAQGPAGAVQPAPLAAAAQLKALEAPVEEGLGAVPEEAAPEVGAAPPPAAPDVEVPARIAPTAEAAQPARTIAGWFLLVFWAFLLLGAGIAVALAIARYRRSH